MLKKWILPAILAFSVIGAAAEPVSADREGNRRQIARRARRLHREGRLSRSHYNRTMDKLNQRKGKRWNRQVNGTLTKWSRAHDRR